MRRDDFLGERPSPVGGWALAAEINRQAVRRWMFDAEFVARCKTAMDALELLDTEVTHDVKLGVIIGAHLATEWPR